jgi:hypothetical protein
MNSHVKVLTRSDVDSALLALEQTYRLSTTEFVRSEICDIPDEDVAEWEFLFEMRESMRTRDLATMGDYLSTVSDEPVTNSNVDEPWKIAA